MLRITQSESTTAAKNYFSQSLLHGDYYFKGQEMAGNWGGRAAEQLGLAGRVDHDRFLMLLENRGPDGKRLTGKTLANRRPGYDFTFDVPKSVSVLYAIGGDERVVDAMRRAVDATMREIEEEMHARVRKNGAMEDRRTGNMVWADFVHTTSRPAPLAAGLESELLAAEPWLAGHLDKEGKLRLPDPHLHVHVYAMNATYDPVENQWKAGEFMRLKRDATYYQAAYHARLAGELQKLGYTIEATSDAFEVAGVGRKVIEPFSRRTQEVEKAAAALGITNAEAKDRLGAKTRRGKNHALSMGQLKPLWRRFVSREDSNAVLRTVAEAQAQDGQPVIDLQRDAHAGITFALGHELERVSEVSERRLLATALRRAVGRASVETMRSAFQDRPEILGAVIDGERRVTTKEVLAEESALMAIVRDGRGRLPPLASGQYEFRNELFHKPTMDTREQRAAVLHVMETQDWVVGIVGRAGTGKTTLLREIADGLKSMGKDMVICAPTAEAARGVLRGEGFSEADTVKRLLTDPAQQARLRGNVLVVDEAGMVGTKDMRAVLELAKREKASRVVLSGDPTQIRSVARGDALKFLEENAGLKVARLEAVKRQKTPVLKAAVEALSRGDVSRGFLLLRQQKAIVEAEPEECHRRLARAYVEKSGGQKPSVLVVSPTHAEGEDLTRAIREELRTAGKIGKTERPITRLVNLKWTPSEKTNPAAYCPGMVVQFKQNAEGFTRGERVCVKDSEHGKVEVSKEGGQTMALPVAKADRFEVYREEELPVAAGERLRVTQNGFDRSGGHRLDNGAFVTIAGFTKAGDLQLENGRVLPADFGHLNHGYVMTADAAQSKTVDVVLAAVSQQSLGATDLRRLYVTISRARQEAVIYTDDAKAVEDAARRDAPRRSAMEMLTQGRRERVRRFLEVQRVQKAMEATRRLRPPILPVRDRRRERRGMEMTHG